MYLRIVDVLREKLDRASFETAYRFLFIFNSINGIIANDIRLFLTIVQLRKNYKFLF